MGSMTPADVRDLLEGYCLDTATNLSLTGDTTVGSPVINDANVAAVKLYMKVSGAGIPAGAIVSDVDPLNSRFEISLPATATANDVPLTLTQYDQVSDAWLVKARDERVLPFVERKVGFKIDGAEGRITEFRNGTGSSIVILSRRPVTQVHSINLVTNPSNWVYVAPSSVEVIGDEGILKLRTVLEAWTSYVPAFPRGKDNLKIDYSYGYGTAPDDLTGAVNCLLAVEVLNHVGARTGGGSVNVPGMGRNYGPRGKYTDRIVQLERWAYASIRRYATGMT